MSRPRKVRYCQCKPCTCYFKPQGIPIKSLGEVDLFPDELEALKLADVDGLEQVTAAKKMNISQPTFARIVSSAHKKLSSAVTFGKAIKIREK
jgi:predicted DNA-binding protein (UPF0251 family)